MTTVKTNPLFTLGFWVLMGMLGMVLLFQVGPFLETTFWPVYSKFEIVEAEEVEGGTMATFSYTKYRDCEPRGAEWFIGVIGVTQRQVKIEVQGRGVIRPSVAPGRHMTSPYLIDISKQELEQNLYAELYSRCPWIPWVTRTVIYP